MVMFPPYGDGGHLLCLWFESLHGVTVSNFMKASSAGKGRDLPPLWHVYHMQYFLAYHGLPLVAQSALAMSGGVVFHLEGVGAGLPRSLVE